MHISQDYINHKPAIKNGKVENILLDLVCQRKKRKDRQLKKCTTCSRTKKLNSNKEKKTKEEKLKKAPSIGGEKGRNFAQRQSRRISRLE